ncbi:hypothetical protein EV421DRAFT_1662747, partial [Armillaria borealis]
FTRCLIVFLILCPRAKASMIQSSFPSAALSIYALNANGMHHALKVIHINNAIAYRNPSIFVISELKSSTSTAGRLTNRNYNVFEERSQPTTGTWKWGVILGVRGDIQVVQRLSLSDAILKSRVLAVDIALSDNNGRAFLHRVFAVYAPWNPGSNSANFWTSLANLCNSTPHGWSLAGDLNATVSSIEGGSSGDDNRQYFREFLERTGGQDLWQKNPERSARNDWTCQAKDRSRGGNIIDRVVTSAHGILDGHPKVSRIRYPKATEKALFKAYETEAEEMARELSLFEVEVNDEASWIRLYQGLTQIVTGCVERHFGRSQPYSKLSTMATLTSPMIQALLAERRHIGGSLYLLRNPENAHVSPGTIAYLQRFMRQIPHGSLDSTETWLIARRKTLAKELYNERSREAYEQSRKSDRQKIRMSLNSGSTKKLVNTVTEFAGLPLVINRVGSDELIADPEMVKEETRAYFMKLYDRPPPPNVPKPWMDMPSVTKIRDKVAEEPFQWPKQASISDYRSMLRKGNNKPSPGPDGWEKWCVKALNDQTLELVLQLHNYMVNHSTFPGNVKDVWATALYKKGLRTDLSNYPGIETWANRHKQPVWCIKRDQMKRFDYLSLQGFHDAIRAYGLPSDIIKLDTAAQSRV